MCISKCISWRFGENAVHDEPVWFQRHGCKFITGVTLEARGGRHANAKRGKERVDVFR